jgi:hypothetical protein
VTNIFVVCFLAGLGLSAVSFAGFGHHHGGHHGGHHHGHHHGSHRASSLNLVAITAGLVWFGGGGLLMQRLTPLAAPLIVAGAAVIGLAGGSLINRVINALARRESTAEALTMVGTIARTTIPIRAGDGTGEIVFTHQGTRQVAGARSDSGHEVGKGAEVVVTRYEKGIAYVATWDELTPDE